MMNKYNFSIHKLVLIIVAFLVGAIHVSHHFLMPKFINNADYYPVNFKTEFDQAITYGPRAQSAYLGMGAGGDISLAEYIKGPSVLPIINPYALSLIALGAGSLSRAFVIADFLLPIIIFWLMYLLLRDIFKKKWGAIFGAIIFIFMPTAGILIPPLSLDNLQSLGYKLLPFLNFSDSLFLARFEYPNVTYIFYLSALLFVYRSLKDSRRLNVILAGLSAGSLFYTYTYDWVYVLSGLGIMGIIFLLQKNYQQAKTILSIILIALFCSAYYWLNMFVLSSLPQYQDIITRIGVESGRLFRFFTWKTYIRSILWVIILWLILNKKNLTLWVYLSGLILPIIAVLNLQLITGINPQPDHWYRELFVPLFISWSAIIAWAYCKYSLKRFQPPIIIATVLAASLLLCGQAYAQFLYSKNYANDHIISKNYLDSYQWLAANTKQASVVAALSPETNVDLLLHTHNKVFYPSGINSLAPNQEIWSRFIAINLIFNVSEESFADSISPNKYILTHLFHDQYLTDSSFNSYFKGESNRVLPDAVYQQKVSEYHEMKNNLSKYQIPYRIDYVYIDKTLNNAQPTDIFLGDLVYENNGIKIYQYAGYKN